MHSELSATRELGEGDLLMAGMAPLKRGRSGQGNPQMAPQKRCGRRIDVASNGERRRIGLPRKAQLCRIA